jgi:DNA-binding FadR family transcriptional regulator
VDFHTELVRATDLPSLEILLSPIQKMMQATSIVARDDVDPAGPTAWRVEIHRALFNAIASRDRNAVAAANEAHWQMLGYEEVRRMRVGDMFLSPRELLSNSEANERSGR